MNSRRTLFIAALTVASLAAGLRADFVIYRIGSAKIYLPGKVTKSGDLVTYKHPTIDGTMYFPQKDIEIKRYPTPSDELKKLVGSAGKDPDKLMKAALFGLKKGKIREFHEIIKRVLAADPQHKGALLVAALKEKMDKPIGENSDEEKQLRSFVRASSKMRVETSDHFILLTDTPERPEKGKRVDRAHERLKLLEDVYQTFLLLFHAQDIELDIPDKRLMVVLFNEYDDYLEFATGHSPALASAAGFYNPHLNISVFFDNGTTARYKSIQKLIKGLKDQVEESKKSGGNNARLVNFVKTLDLLMEVERESADVSVISHECTHQMAGNTGLLPRHVDIPRWVHEGLATYFEAPSDAAWAGIGAVNEERIDFYRALAEHDKLHSTVDFIVGDQIFDHAGGYIGNILHGYAQAWALTHYLVENRLPQLVDYYKMLGNLPPDVTLNPTLLIELFDRAMQSDHKTIDQEWRKHMRTLKTDVERIEEDD